MFLIRTTASYLVCLRRSRFVPYSLDLIRRCPAAPGYSPETTADGNAVIASGKMDWQGQKLAEQLMQIMLLGFAVVGFATGYMTGSFQMMVLVYAGGVVLTTVVTIPNWPFFNRHPLKWLDPSEAEKHPKPERQQPVTSKKKTSRK